MVRTTKKIVFVGDAKSGKTTIMGTLRNKSIVEYRPTLGVEVYPNVYNNTVYKCWDTAGNPRYAGLNDGYYSQADGFVIVVDGKGDVKEQMSRWLANTRKVIQAPTLIIINGGTLDELLSKRDDVLYVSPFTVSLKDIFSFFDQ